jgi:transposase, IS5 family
MLTPNLVSLKPAAAQGGQAGGDHGRALQPCPSVQAHAQGAEVPAHPARPRHQGHPAQDCHAPRLAARFERLLGLASRVRQQDQRTRGRKVYALHAPEVECIGKGKARAPYEFGCKVSITTPVTSPKGGQFVLHAAALHGNPYDGHTLGPMIAATQAITGVEPKRIHVDKGYRGHNHPNRFKVWISGQVRRTTKTLRREMKRRAAIEPVIGHVKAEHRMDRNYLKGRDGDRINAVLAAAGYNFSLLIRWFAALWRAWIATLIGELIRAPRWRMRPA